MALEIFKIDPSLESCQGQIWDRVNGYKWWKDELAKNEGGLEKFAEGYKIFGFVKEDGGYRYTEWLPNAKQVFLTGEFNGWQNSTPLASEGFGRWSVHLPNKSDGSPMIPHRCQIKVRIETNDGNYIERVPAWTKLAWQDHKTNLFNGVFWEPDENDRYAFRHGRPSRPTNLKIYEAHVGMASCDPRVATYLDFARDVLPRIKRLGYNAVQLMAVAEHAHYGCFGYHVTSFFAPASRSGTPEELKELVDVAHGLGIVVLMDVVHAHASSNTLDGIAQMDGTDHCYTHGGAKGHHSEWDSKIFHYTKYEVLRFLLSNVKWWIEEYGFDGFRFDGITSMLYQSHGIGKGYTGGYHEYFGADADIESHVYLMLANDLIHSILPSAITVGEDVSGMPTLCRPVHEGGFGFDYRLAMAIPDMFIKLLKEGNDNAWGMGHITHTLTNRRWKENVIAYAESHDQAIVGDKTLAFWLMDAEMYTGMSCLTSPCPSMAVDRGLSLHKMIRLLVLGLGGEGYLTFMGNEFGHPEWIDFPRPQNDWSHHHCRRRWDLAEDDLLRYKFFQSFDELMQLCESRFGWLTSAHQYVTVKSETDKVIAFERGDLLFIFNFHPCNSYTDYMIGVGWNEPMRCVLDSDEHRFGGQGRLGHGHANAFPVLGGHDGRAHSVQLYLPSRTVQVLCKESKIGKCIKLYVDPTFLQHAGVGSACELTIKMEVGDKKIPVDFGDDGCATIMQESATFTLQGPAGEVISCMASKDAFYRVYFPGDYTISGIGYLANCLPADAVPIVPGTSEESFRTECVAAEQNHVPVDESARENEQASEKDEDERSRVCMARCSSGLHFVSCEVLDALDEAETQDTGLNFTRKLSGPAEDAEDRVGNYSKAVAKLGSENGMLDYASSYRTFGLHQLNSSSWTFREWIPGARSVHLVGDFNNWDRCGTPLEELETNTWAGEVSGSAAEGLSKGSKYKLLVQPVEGSEYWCVSAWSTRYVLTEETRSLDSVVWPLEQKTERLEATTSPIGSRIYECNLKFLAADDASFCKRGAEELIPWISQQGYTDVLVVGAVESKETVMGQQPVGLFAPSHTLGEPEEFMNFVTVAHKSGLRVLLSIMHGGSATCTDGLGGQYFDASGAGLDPSMGIRAFDYTKVEVQRYLLSSLHFWMNEYGIDGFRFQNVSEMIYADRALWVPADPEALDEYIAGDGKINNEAVHYLMMANALIREVDAHAVSIADEFTNFPALCQDVSSGGIGFDLCQTCQMPSLLRKFLGSCRDEEWNIEQLVDTAMSAKLARPSNSVVGCTESLANCTVAKRPLRIAMLSWETLHTVAAGGVAPHVTELASALHSAGHEVHIFTRSSNGTTWTHPIWGVVYHEVAFQTSPDFVREIENMCCAFVGNCLHFEGVEGAFDVIHGHDWLVGPAMVQLQAMGKKTVFTIHSTETGRCGNVQYGGQSARIRDIEAHVCHAAERIIAVSGVLKEETVSHYNVDNRKVEVIYNGIHAAPIVNMEWRDVWSGNTKRDKGFDAMSPMFLFVGRLTVQKGPDLLLDAIPMVLQARGDAKFVIVGEGYMKTKLEADAARMGISHAVHFAGSLKSGSEHLRALFKSCDAVVVPSRNEPFGIVVLEAWAAGKPVVATTCGGPRDFVTPQEDGYLVDPNPNSIAWGIQRICENFEHARWMGEHAREKALNEFNWAAIAERTTQVYYEQMNLHGLPFCRNRANPLQGAPLAAELLGPHRDRMAISSDCALTGRGVAMLNQFRLLAASLGSDSMMTWMGSEFGQMDTTDPPRPGNNMKPFTIPYDLAQNTDQKYSCIARFASCVNRAQAVLGWMSDSAANVITKDEDKKVLGYTRGGCLFAFNFHPSEVHDGYIFQIPAVAKLDENLSTFIISSETVFGGCGACLEAPMYSAGAVRLSMPPRASIIIGPSELAHQFRQDCGLPSL